MEEAREEGAAAVSTLLSLPKKNSINCVVRNSLHGGHYRHRYYYTFFCPPCLLPCLGGSGGGTKGGKEGGKEDDRKTERKKDRYR